GELTLVEKNPGLAGWLIDSDLTVRGGVVVGPDGTQQIMLRDTGEGAYSPFLEIPHEDSSGTGIVSFSRDGRSVLMHSTIGVNASRLLSVDLGTGEETVLAADDTYDV